MHYKKKFTIRTVKTCIKKRKRLFNAHYIYFLN